MARRLSETIYFIRDMDEAIRFYTEQVGFRLEQRYDWGFAVLSIDGHNRLGLMLESAWEREYPDNNELPRPRLALQTDDFSGELHRLASMGIRTGTLQGHKGGRRATTFLDPDENVIFLWTDPEESMTESDQTPGEGL